MPDITSTSGFGLQDFPRYPGFENPNFFALDPSRILQGFNQGLDTTSNAATMVDRIRAANAQAQLQTGQAGAQLGLLPQQTALASQQLGAQSQLLPLQTAATQGGLQNTATGEQLQQTGLNQSRQQLAEFGNLLKINDQVKNLPDGGATILNPQTLAQIQALSKASQLTGGLTPTFEQFQAAPGNFAKIADINSQIAQRGAEAAKNQALALALPPYYNARANDMNAQGAQRMNYSSLNKAASDAGLNLNDYVNWDAYNSAMQQWDDNGQKGVPPQQQNYLGPEFQTDLQDAQAKMEKLKHPKSSTDIDLTGGLGSSRSAPTSGNTSTPGNTFNFSILPSGQTSFTPAQ